MTAKPTVRLTDLTQRGWKIHRELNHPPAIRTNAHNWENLAWAHRTALRARFGFDIKGSLTLTLNQLENSQELLKCLLRSRRQPGGAPMPRGTFPGADNRLREILEQERLSISQVKHDRWGLHHQGPDGSLIYTSREFWGPLDDGYPEVQENDYAEWDQTIYGTPEAPCWACPECNIPGYVT